MFEMEFAVLLATEDDFIWFCQEFWILNDYYRPVEKQITDLDPQ